MRFNALKTRLLALERKGGAADAVLKFADGSSRVVRVRDPLGLFCAVATRISWRIGQPDGDARDERTEPFYRSEGAPAPVSQFDEVIDLLGRAAEVESSDIFISGVVHGLCVEATKEAV